MNNPHGGGWDESHGLLGETNRTTLCKTSKDQKKHEKRIINKNQAKTQKKKKKKKKKKATNNLKFKEKVWRSIQRGEGKRDPELSEGPGGPVGWLAGGGWILWILIPVHPGGGGGKSCHGCSGGGSCSQDKEGGCRTVWGGLVSFFVQCRRVGGVDRTTKKKKSSSSSPGGLGTPGKYLADVRGGHRSGKKQKTASLGLGDWGGTFLPTQ